MLWAVGAGDLVVATDLFSNFPEAANDTGKLDSFNFNVEEVASYDPDLVIIAFDFQGEPEQLGALEIPFLLLTSPPSVDGMFDQLQAIGDVTGYGAAATDLVDGLRKRVTDIEADAGPLSGLTFFHEVDETLYSTTSSSFLGDVYSRLGLVNIADGPGGDNPFPQLSPEYILGENPWLIFLGDAAFGVTPEAVAARPGWETLTAVAEGNLIALDEEVSGRWGPRTVDLMEQILEAALETLS